MWTTRSPPATPQSSSTSAATASSTTSGGSFPREPGIYQIVGNYDNKCLNVYKASTATGAPVHQYGCSVTATNNLWRFEPVPGETTFHIISVAGSQCLNISGSSTHPSGTDDGAPLIIYPCNTSALNDQFYFPPATSGALSAPLPVISNTPPGGRPLALPGG